MMEAETVSLDGGSPPCSPSSSSSHRNRRSSRKMRIAVAVIASIAGLTMIVVGAFYGGVAWEKDRSVSQTSLLPSLSPSTTEYISRPVYSTPDFEYAHLYYGATLAVRGGTGAATNANADGFSVRFSRDPAKKDMSLQMAVDYPTNLPIGTTTTIHGKNDRHIRILFRDTIAKKEILVIPLGVNPGGSIPKNTTFLVESEKAHALASSHSTFFDDGVPSEAVQVAMDAFRIYKTAAKSAIAAASSSSSREVKLKNWSSCQGDCPDLNFNTVVSCGNDGLGVTVQNLVNCLDYNDSTFDFSPAGAQDCFCCAFPQCEFN